MTDGHFTNLQECNLVYRTCSSTKSLCFRPLQPGNWERVRRGLDNRVYYMLAPQGQYYNYSGCGNTVNCNHPLVRGFILDALRYWVQEMHVDGFRFDLGAIMTRTHSLWHPPSLLASSPDADALAPQGEALRLATASRSHEMRCLDGHHALH